MITGLACCQIRPPVLRLSPSGARRVAMPTVAAAPPASWRPSASPAAFCRRSASAFPSDRSMPCALLRRFLRLGLSRRAADTPPQGLHQIDDVLTARPLLRHDRLARALAVDQVDQRGFIVVLELFRLEGALLLVHDVLRQIQHVLRHFDVLSSKYSSSLRTSYG